MEVRPGDTVTHVMTVIILTRSSRPDIPVEPSRFSPFQPIYTAHLDTTFKTRDRPERFVPF